MSVSAGLRRPWLVGVVPDLIFGCGLGYLLLVGVLAIVRPDMGRLQPFLPLVILVTGIPHYGATLLRVYGTAGARKRYAFHGVYLSALVWLIFGLAAYQPLLGSLIITLYLSWSPWHYAGQNYGLTLMFLGRGGVKLSPRARTVLFASFVLSTALIVLNYHRLFSVGSGDPMFDPGGVYRFVPLGIPEPLAQLLFPALAVAYAATLAVLVWLLRGAARPALLPAAALILIQSIWFAIPAAVAHFAGPGLLASVGAPTAFVWIALGHSVQYLWVSHHFARTVGDGGTGRHGGLLGGLLWGASAVLAGAAIWVIPALAFAPGALGRVPFDAGLGLLVAAAVNLHHFVLDGAIWKLRDPRVSQVLVAEGRTVLAGPEADRPGARVFSRTIFVAAGVFSVVCWIGTAWEKEVGHRQAYAAGDLARLRLAEQRLRFFGREGPHLHLSLGRLEERLNHPEVALAEYCRSLSLEPTAGALAGIGRLSLVHGDLTAAEEAYRAALALSPGRESLQRRLEEVRAALEKKPTLPSEATSRAYFQK